MQKNEGKCGGNADCKNPPLSEKKSPLIRKNRFVTEFPSVVYLRLLECHLDTTLSWDFDPIRHSHPPPLLQSTHCHTLQLSAPLVTSDSKWLDARHFGQPVLHFEFQTRTHEA